MIRKTSRWAFFELPPTQMHDFPTELSSNLLKQNETAILINDAISPFT